MSTPPPIRVRIAVYVALAVVTALSYAQVVTHDFVEYDDPLYVTHSEMTQRGITWEGVRWAFTDTSSGNWHPLTRLSHMLDCELFGMNPAGHHAVNVAWHVANSVLLCAVLASLTGAFWRSAMVAALFALHPLHVESVAWISERKDVVSTFFWIAAMGLYGKYARTPSLLRYLAVAAALCLGLMAKAMLVTLPCVLLLLDYWPLHRYATDRPWLRSAARLSLEKLPLFAIAGAHSAATVMAQQVAMTTMDSIPLAQRFGNALIAYGEYLRKMIWPSDLAVFYPYPLRENLWPGALVAGAVILVVTLAILYLWRRSPYLGVGWFWYFGTLVPVIGLVQVGAQRYADRYTYVPLIGIFIALVWLGAEIVTARPKWRTPAIVSMLIVAAAAGYLTERQSRHWKNTTTLFEHAIQVTDDNWLAYTNVGHELLKQDRTQEARPYFERAVEISDRVGWINAAAKAFFGLGIIEDRAENWDGAVAYYRAAISVDPVLGEAMNNLGSVYMAKWRLTQDEAFFNEAMRWVNDALTINPDNHEAQLNAAFLYQIRAEKLQDIKLYRWSGGLYALAIPYFDDNAIAHRNYGKVLAALGKFEEAIHHAERALEIDPDFAEAKADLLLYRHAQAKPQQVVP